MRPLREIPKRLLAYEKFKFGYKATVARVILGLGSNIGNRAELIQFAVNELSSKIQIEKVSSLYETAPMYVQDQPPFLNAALLGETILGPLALLEFAKQVEGEIGRQAREKYGPREVDIDLVYYGSLQLQCEGCNLRPLRVPHPLTAERRFVLEPLAEIAPESIIPGFGIAIDLLETTKVQAQSVFRVTDATLSLHSN